MKKHLQKSKDLVFNSMAQVRENFSLALTSISFCLIVVTGLLQVFEKIKSTGPFMELFITCGSLYLGRKSFDAFLEYKKSKEK